MFPALIPVRPEEQRVHEHLLRDACLTQVTRTRSQPLLKSGLLALTPTERIVAFHLKFGLSNKEVSARLGKAEATVKNQVASVLRKLGVPSRARLVALLWAVDVASQPSRTDEAFVVCGSSVRRLAAEECSVSRAGAGVRCRPASRALAFA